MSSLVIQLQFLIKIYLQVTVPGRVDRFKKIKRPNLAISSFKKGQISFKNFVTITKIKFRIS